MEEMWLGCVGGPGRSVYHREQVKHTLTCANGRYTKIVDSGQ